MVVTLLILACAQSPQPVAVAGVEELDMLDVLTRASIDLRGTRPTLDEIQAIEADPELLDETIVGFTHDAGFGTRVRSFFADIYQTRQDTWSVTGSDYGFTDEAGWSASVGDEPLRILSTIAENDLPYTEVVTGDWSMADENLGNAWPVDYPEGATGWQQVRYTDGRPTAGVLTTNAMWWRYQSNGSNGNRGRANAISRILLCIDYLGKPIEFDRSVNLLDNDAVNDALKTNEGCVACHYSLDPLASYLWGFYYIDYTSRTDTQSYHPERESMWQTMTEVSPAYYGQPGYSMSDLGQQIAADPKLAECVTEQVFEQMVQRESTSDDTERLTAMREVFLAEGMTLRSLYQAAAVSPEYRALSGEAMDGGDAAGRKLLSPDLMASVIEDLTGYRFTYYGYDMMGTDTYGLRTLAGGVDGLYSTRAAEESTATMVLSQQRLAEAAAWYVVEHDRTLPAEALLFTEVGFTDTPQSDRDAMVAQVQKLHLRVLGSRVDADGPEVAANLELWQSLYQMEGDPSKAWAGLLSALIRDPEFLLY